MDAGVEPVDTLLTCLILVIAVLYSSVGHAGASGYLAAMALLGVAPEVMKPTALVLNILVASVATLRFVRAGVFSWSLFWPLAVTSVPMAFVGGMLHLPAHWYKPVVGVVLLFAAVWSLRSTFLPFSNEIKHPPFFLLLLTGALLGLLSGLTGVGGGIFLSPLLLVCAWAETRVVSGISAVFILVNSIAGLAGLMTTGIMLPAAWPFWGAAALAGGIVGSHLGSRVFSPRLIRRLLAVVLLVAAIKMIAQL